MKAFLICTIAILLLPATVLGDSLDVTITLNPSIEVYPPGYNTTFCDTNGTAPCVVFSGTITDNDTDGSLLFLTGMTISADTSYFTVDNTFYNDTPGVYEGDNLDLVASNSYGPGPIFGLDIAPGTPANTYMLNAIFSGSGGTNDPGYAGFTVTVPFAVVVVPEPKAMGLMAAGILGIAVLRRRRARVC